MPIREYLRSIARRLPISSSYERRIVELTSQVNHVERLLHETRSLATPEGKMFVPAGHFYSPIVNQSEVLRDAPRIFGQDPLDVPGVAIDLDNQWKVFEQLAPLMADLDLARNRRQAEVLGARYWIENPAFGDGDASALAAMLRFLQPKRLVELGCGYSSACALDTRDRFLDDSLRITFVDPFPELLHDLLREGDMGSVDVHQLSTQEVPKAWVEGLEAGDILFIDSTHVCKTGSDVNHIFFEIFPALNPGVVIHLHDVFPGFEYPRPWVEEGRSWNELYLLRAFLQYNSNFEIFCFPSLLHHLDTERHRALAPQITNIGGSCWIRKLA